MGVSYKISTGIWQVAYNVENRPMRFVNESAKTVVECTYDYMGRRHTRKVSVNGTVSSYLRYMYRGYLQIAAIDAVSGAFRWFLFQNLTQPEATRPLPIRKDGAQPIQWSSEYREEELGFVYYNYRHLNPRDGRWLSRDPIMEQGGWNLYLSLKNNSYLVVDYLGTIPPPGGFWTGTTGYESLRIPLSAPSNSKKEFD